MSGVATADHRHRRVGYGCAGDDGGWAPQSPLGPSPDRDQVPGPASISKPPAATFRGSVDTLGSYDSHNPFDRRGVGHRRRARFPQPREAAARERRHRQCAIRPSGRRDAASPRSSVSSRRLYGAHNSGITDGHGHAVGATIATVGGCCTKARKDPCASDGGTTDRDLRSIARSHPNPGPGGRVDLMCYPVAQLMHQKVEWFVRQPRGQAQAGLDRLRRAERSSAVGQC